MMHGMSAKGNPSTLLHFVYLRPGHWKRNIVSILPCTFGQRNTEFLLDFLKKRFSCIHGSCMSYVYIDVLSKRLSIFRLRKTIHPSPYYNVVYFCMAHQILAR